MSRLSTDRGEAIIIPPVSHEPPAVHPEIGTVREEKSAAIIDPEVAAAPSMISEVWDHEQYPLPTDEERKTLRKVPDTIPAIAYILCVAELAERASYYATTGVFNNFMEYGLPVGGNGAGAPAKSDVNGVAGALGKGVQFASALVLLFTFLAYVFPILGAWIADTKLGRYKTILWGVGIGAVAHVIMVGGSAPSVLKAGNGIAPFMISFFMLAIGAGIFKPNVAPTVLDQYKHQREYVKTLKSGERVVVDPETTIQRIMVIYYGFINVGAFFALASTYAERYVGYWLAYLLPTIMYCAVIIVFLSVKNKIVKKPPMGSELNKFFKITWVCLKESKFMFWKKNFWDAARPAHLAEKGKTAAWNNRLVTDVSRTWSACQIFLYIPIYQLNDGGIGAASTNLAGSMTLNGAPNDLLSNFNALTIIVFTPVFAFGIYPLLNRFGIHFGTIKRMTIGMTIAAISGVCGGLAQLYVYRTSPCGYQASTCELGVSPVSVWWELPMIMLGAVSEILVNATSYEMAYARAPPSMKSVVFSICLFMTALYAAAGEVLTPVIQDPYLVWVWMGPAIVLFVQTAIFWIRHHNIDEDAYMTYDSDSDTEEAVLGKEASTGEARAEKDAAIYEKSL
ncbi:Peptide transporter PTR2 [Cytospora mali]|uniref:Peptide transporter PTR2 n=1 Tax=Cytospora mali TaxID=578113 RepID=A0A194VXK2_CYTMA|nr:Peptide transporter PTR2 [Valsa mali]